MKNNNNDEDAKQHPVNFDGHQSKKLEKSFPKMAVPKRFY